MQTTPTPSQVTQVPLISFIVPVYDLPVDLLRSCLDSILRLSLDKSEREIVVVDDGSSESPLDQLSSYRDDILYIRQSNSGLSMARNLGIQCSSGTYLQFVDGDDMLNAPAYDYCLRLVRQYLPDIVSFLPTDKPAGEVPQRFEGPMSGCEYMRHHNLRPAAWGYLFKRSLLLGQRFTPGILHEDEEFTPLLFLRADQLIATASPAYYYRQRPESIMHQKDEAWIEKRLTDTRDVLFRLHDRCATLPQEMREALQRRVHQLTMDYLYNVITLTRSSQRLEESLPVLEAKGLFPLPDKHYTSKYSLFRKLVNSKVGRKVLCRSMGVKS